MRRRPIRELPPEFRGAVRAESDGGDKMLSQRREGAENQPSNPELGQRLTSTDKRITSAANACSSLQ
eukprot:11767471-Alexandrium_andersonii.AAC.1